MNRVVTYFLSLSTCQNHPLFVPYSRILSQMKVGVTSPGIPVALFSPEIEIDLANNRQTNG